MVRTWFHLRILKFPLIYCPCHHGIDLSLYIPMIFPWYSQDISIKFPWNSHEIHSPATTKRPSPRRLACQKNSVSWKSTTASWNQAAWRAERHGHTTAATHVKRKKTKTWKSMSICYIIMIIMLINNNYYNNDNNIYIYILCRYTAHHL